MKKTVLALGAACVATFGIYAASDRIDVYNRAGSFTSIMVDRIQEISFGKDAAQDGFSTLKVTTPTGEISHDISDVAELKYSPVIPNLAHEILFHGDEHSKVRLLDWRNNTDVYGEAQIDPTKPADWRGCWANGNPHFLVDTDKGWVSEFSITGKYTNTVYTENPNFVFWSMKEFNLLGIDSYSFDMPFEPVEIASTAYELDTYRDAPFLGDYKGYSLIPGENRITKKAQPVMSVHFDANTTYHLTSTDASEFDVFDLYTWDEAKNTVAYVPYEGEMRNPVDVDVWDGLIGKFSDGGLLFASMHKIYDDKFENTVRYFAVRGEGEVTVASADAYNQNILVEYADSEGQKHYFYYPSFYHYPVTGTMEWVYGNSLGGKCQGFFVSEEGKIFKYTYTEGGMPTFVNRGREYGTYTGASDDLTLDGYKDCTIGETKGTYVIEGGVVTATFGSDVRIFVIDLANKTYTETVSDKWDGQTRYTLENAKGAFRGGAVNSNNSMIIDMDKDFSGNDVPGVASVRFKVARSDGFSGYDDITDEGKYIYDAANNTITITNISMGTSATSSGRSTIKLKVSDDRLSMWVDESTGDKIYCYGNVNSYLLTGPENTMTAPAPAKPIKLAAEYKGAPNMLAFGNAAPTETVLTVDATDTKATLSIKGMGTSMVNATVDYTLEGTVLTLVGVPTLTDKTNPYLGTTPTDVVFNVSDDGSTLTGTQSIFLSGSGMPIEVDLTSAPLVGEVAGEDPEPEPIKLAAEYKGAPNMLAFGNAAPTETVLTVDATDTKATLSIKGMGTSMVNATVDYTLEGTVLTLVGVPTLTDKTNPYLGTTPTDVVFNVSEDGSTLTGTQSIFLSGSGMPIEVDLTSAPLAAAE